MSLFCQERGATTDIDCFQSPSISLERRPLRNRRHRRGTSLREVLNALLYLLHTECPWHMLPSKFPPRDTLYGYFRRFWQEGGW